MDKLYFLIVKHTILTVIYHNLCPVDSQGNLFTKFLETARMRALQNKALNPECEYFVAEAIEVAKINPAPKYHMVPYGS